MNCGRIRICPTTLSPFHFVVCAVVVIGDGGDGGGIDAIPNVQEDEIEMTSVEWLLPNTHF